MSNELVTRDAQHVEYIEKNKDLIAGQNKLSKGDLENFLIQCKRTGLDPITRQIYAIPMQGKLNIMASIDGLRLIAERSGAYEGQTSPQWCGEDGIWKDIWLQTTPPKAAKVGVYKTKFREALFAVALFDEYAKKTNGNLDFMWKKMPALMISKVAESLALRKAFPNEMSGIYSTEEMDQASKDVSPTVNVEAALQGAKTEAINVESKDVVDHGEFVNTFGTKYKNKKISEIFPHEHESMITFLKKEQAKGNYKIKSANDYLFHAEAYLQLEPKLNEADEIPF